MIRGTRRAKRKRSRETKGTIPGLTAYLTQTQCDARYLQSFTIPSQYLTETEGDARYLQSFTIPSEYLTETEGDARYFTLNQISTAAKIGIGHGSGSVALTRNDSYGSANVCFNHTSGTPDNTQSDQSSCRIECTVDSTTASMIFELGDSVTQSTPVSLTEVMRLLTNRIYCYKDVYCSGDLSVTGSITGTCSGNLTETLGDARYARPDTTVHFAEVSGGSGSNTLVIGDIGYTGWGGAAQQNNLSGGSYALMQSSTGETRLNCKLEQLIRFCQGNVERGKIDANGNFEFLNNLTVNGQITGTTTGNLTQTDGDARYFRFHSISHRNWSRQWFCCFISTRRRWTWKFDF